MKNKPLLSVIVPMYNARNYMPELLSSIWAQELDDIEVIIVDDESKDQSASYIQKLEDRRIKLIRIRHSGPCVATNTGLRAARGKYVAFLEIDDLWYPWKSSEQIRIFEENPNVAWSATDFDVFNRSTGRILFRRFVERNKHKLINSTFPENYALTSTVMYRRKDVEKIGYFNEGFKYFRYDVDFFLKLGNIFGPDRSVFVLRPCILYNNIIRSHENAPNRSTSFFLKQIRSKRVLSERGKECLLDEAHWQIQRTRIQHYRKHNFPIPP